MIAEIRVTNYPKRLRSKKRSMRRIEIMRETYIKLSREIVVFVARKKNDIFSKL